MKKATAILILLLNAFCFSFAQKWTWMHGDSSFENQAIIGTIGVPAANNKPCGVRQAASWSDANGDFWFYGGTNNYLSLDILGVWKYSIATNQWALIKKAATVDMDGLHGTKGVASPINNPGYRRLPVSWTDNNGNFWMFGGSIEIMGSEKFRNDLWKYDPITNMWTWVSGDSTYNGYGNFGTTGSASPTNLPGTRTSAAGWKDTNGNLWLYGGRTSGGGYYSDLWKYEIATNLWTRVKGTLNEFAKYGTMGIPSSSSTPGGLEGSVSLVDLNGDFWLFGGIAKFPIGNGSTMNTVSNTLWKYEIANNKWTWIKGDTNFYSNPIYGAMGIPNSNNKPHGCNYASGWVDALGNLVIYGGNTTTNFSNLQYSANLWSYNITTNKWTWLKGSQALGQMGIYGTKGIEANGNTPGSRGHTMSWSANGYLWLFGGYGFSINSYLGHLNNVWRLNLGNATSIEQISSDYFDISVYPNPSSDVITVNTNQLVENGTISILNAIGQQIYSKPVNELSTIIDIKNYANGFYYVQINGSQKSSIIKFIKN